MWYSIFYKIGVFKIATTSSTTVPSAPGENYTITYNRLTNATTKYLPAIGFVDLDYTFPATGSQGYMIAYNYPIDTTSFKVRIYAVGATPNLTRYSINYLAVSENFNSFYIWINGVGLTILRSINSTTPAVSVITQTGTVFPTIANLRHMVPLSYLSFGLITPLFDIHVSVDILSTTTYNLTL
jgi:hypothetical protein